MGHVELLLQPFRARLNCVVQRAAEGLGRKDECLAAGYAEGLGQGGGAFVSGAKCEERPSFLLLWWP